MATKIPTSTKNLGVKTGTSQEEASNLEAATVDSNATSPTPGRAMSFEEAKAWAFKKYDSALRELAK